MVAPLCSESKELPDVETLRDRMSIQAVEAGLPNGVNPQAAAMLMSALQVSFAAREEREARRSHDVTLNPSILFLPFSLTLYLLTGSYTERS